MISRGISSVCKGIKWILNFICWFTPLNLDVGAYRRTGPWFFSCYLKSEFPRESYMDRDKNKSDTIMWLVSMSEYNYWSQRGKCLHYSCSHSRSRICRKKTTHNKKKTKFDVDPGSVTIKNRDRVSHLPSNTSPLGSQTHLRNHMQTSQNILTAEEGVEVVQGVLGQVNTMSTCL